MAINKHRLSNTEDYLVSILNYFCEKMSEKQDEIKKCHDAKQIRCLCYELIFIAEQISNLDVVFKFLDSIKEEIKDN